MKTIWDEKIQPLHCQPLCEDMSVDCAVIGGGIAGVTTAYLLAKSGVKTALFEAGEIAGGTSGLNTGKVTCQHDNIYSKLAQKSEQTAKFYFQANQEALALIRHLSSIFDAGFEETSTFIYADQQEDVDAIRQELAICKKLGIVCASAAENIPLPGALSGVEFKNQGRYNPKQYVLSLARLAQQNQCRLFTHTRITDIIPGKIVTLKTDQHHQIHAKHVALCTHFPIYDRGRLFFARLNPERSYLISAPFDHDQPQRINDGLNCAYINLRKNARSTNVYNQGFILIGGENHKVGQGKSDYYLPLKQFAAQIAPLTPKYCWSAEDYSTTDNLPFIGAVNKRNPNILIATGFNKWGNTLGTVSGQVISQSILGRPPKYAEIFSPSRISDLFTAIFVAQNSNTASYYIASYMKKADKNFHLENDASKIIKFEGRKYGIYKDMSGTCHVLDITCPHMGCKLGFNPLEKSWDCPCHGSRFDYDGNILNNPANTELKPLGEGINRIHPHL